MLFLLLLFFLLAAFLFVVFIEFFLVLIFKFIAKVIVNKETIIGVSSFCLLSEDISLLLSSTALIVVEFYRAIGVKLKANIIQVLEGRFHILVERVCLCLGLGLFSWLLNLLLLFWLLLLLGTPRIVAFIIIFILIVVKNVALLLILLLILLLLLFAFVFFFFAIFRLFLLFLIPYESLPLEEVGFPLFFLVLRRCLRLIQCRCRCRVLFISNLRFEKLSMQLIQQV